MYPYTAELHVKGDFERGLEQARLALQAEKIQEDLRSMVIDKIIVVVDRVVNIVPKK